MVPAALFRDAARAQVRARGAVPAGGAQSHSAAENAPKRPPERQKAEQSDPHDQVHVAQFFATELARTVPQGGQLVFHLHSVVELDPGNQRVRQGDRHDPRVVRARSDGG